tara:strand:+ start:1615 stop:1968 length:354 start_codon:yes stop_codon:yes gene_type:complete
MPKTKKTVKTATKTKRITKAPTKATVKAKARVRKKNTKSEPREYNDVSDMARGVRRVLKGCVDKVTNDPHKLYQKDDINNVVKLYNAELNRMKLGVQVQKLNLQLQENQRTLVKLDD